MQTARTVYEGTVRAVGYGALALVCALLPFLLLSSGRVVPLFILAALARAYVLKWEGRATWPLKKLWVAFWIVALLVRVDISFIDLPGPPRFTRYVIGMPSPQTMRAAQRGEVLLHGCVPNGFEPFWVLTW